MVESIIGTLLRPVAYREAFFFSPSVRPVVDSRRPLYRSRYQNSALKSIGPVKNFPIPISIHPCDSSTLNNPFMKEQFVQFNLDRSNC